MTDSIRRALCGGAVAALAAVATPRTFAQSVSAQTARGSKVITPDGVSINVQEFGNPNGIEVLFVHGFMQSHLSWIKQLHDPVLGQALRMVAYDFRGHGASDKPMGPEWYGDSTRFADEMHAVISAAGLKRPLVVGWSYGTRIIGDYLVKYGDAGLAGVDFVGGVGNGDPKLFGPGAALLGRALTEDLAEGIRATAAFVRICFDRQPTQEEFETILAFNMVVPPKVRAWLRRPAPYEGALKAIRVPTLVTHGVEDQICTSAIGRYLVRTVPGARGSFYEAVGHSPFWEESSRFNVELLDFARSAHKA